MKPLKLNSELKRYPYLKKDQLQAWDSADELLLQHLSSLELSDKRILILGDRFGALSCPLKDLDISTYTDSYISAQGITLNSQGRITPIHQLCDLSGNYDLVLIRIPKNLSFFEDLLCHLTPHLHPHSQLICAYMIKHQAKGSFDLLNQWIGETQTSLAQKKARLIFASFQRTAVQSRYPLHVQIPGFQIPFINHSNVFSREQLDLGTRFLLKHLPEGKFKTILDLGCGNGIIGIAAKQLNPAAEIIFSDDSQMAIQSARANYQNYFGATANDKAQFLWTHCFENQPKESIDLVLCNPPFHQGTTLGDFIAKQMFKDAKSALTRGGILRVIGNQHLQYPSTLKRLFGNSQIVERNSKFVLVDSIRDCGTTTQPA